MIVAAGRRGRPRRPRSARVSAEAANRARELQAPARERGHPELSRRPRPGDRRRPRRGRVEVLGRDQIAERGMGGLIGGRAGKRRGAAADRPRYSRRRRRRRDARARRQGRHLRHRRDLHQALGQDGGDEDGHVGRRRGARDDRGDRRARLPVNVVACVPATENMPSGTATQPGRHHHAAQRQDGRGEQHRRRGAPDPGRRPHLLRPRAGRPAAGGHRDPDGRGDRRTRLDLRRPARERRRVGRAGRGGGPSEPESSPGVCRFIPSTRT